MMPGMDGYEVCRQLKANPASATIPVIFLTGKSEIADERKGFDLGAADYIVKPISPLILLARVRTHIKLKATADFLRDKNVFLEEEVVRRTRETAAIQDVTALAMASLAETRDSETGKHLLRIRRYVKAMAWKLATNPRFAAELSVKKIGLIYKASPLHDIGKVGIPDRVLLKPGKLTVEEFEVMKTHTTLGRDAIAHAEEELGVEIEVLSLAKEIAYYHHEKWDGTGYPEGLLGEQIPVSARLMALADVYDALICRRIYKEPLPHAQAVKIIEQCSGKHFDPDVVDAFMALQDNFNVIAMAFTETNAEIQRKAEYLEIAIK
jgi:putative two-component system response regulator